MGMWIWRDIFGNRNSPEAIMQAAQYCEQLREQCLHLFFVSTNHPSINAARIAQRVMKGGHDVPIPKIISRYQTGMPAKRLVLETLAGVKV